MDLQGSLALRVFRGLLGLQAPRGSPGPHPQLRDQRAALAPLVPQEQHQLWLGQLGQLGLQAPLGRPAIIPLCPAQLVLLVFLDQLALLARILLLPVPPAQPEMQEATDLRGQPALHQQPLAQPAPQGQPAQLAQIQLCPAPPDRLEAREALARPARPAQLLP